MIVLLILINIFSLKAFSNNDYNRLLKIYQSYSIEEFNSYPVELKQYLYTYYEEVKSLANNSYKIMTKNIFLDGLKNTNIILFEDNHNIGEDKTNLIKTIKSVKNTYTKKKLIFVLEWIPNEFTKEVNAFLEDKNSTNIHLTRIRNKLVDINFFPFNLNEYLNLLKYIKSIDAKIIIPESFKNVRHIKSRDDLIEISIKENFNQDNLYIVLYGGAHFLGKNHLYERFKNLELETRVILTEVDSLFFKNENLNFLYNNLNYKIISLNEDIFYSPSLHPNKRLALENKIYRDQQGPSFEELMVELSLND